MTTSSDTTGSATLPLLGMLAGLCVAIGITHFSSFTVPFHFDDHRNITASRAVLDYVNEGDSTRIRRSNRPFVLWTLAANYKWHAGRPWGYHLVSLLSHMLAACLVFWLSLWALGRRAGGALSNPRLQHWLAWTIALCWGCHPLVSQAVVYIVQRYELFAALFTLLGIASYCLIAGGHRWALLLLGSAAWLGVMSKEPAATLPFLLVLWDHTFCKGLWKQQATWLRPAALAMACTPWLWFLPSVSRWLFPAQVTSSGSTMGFGMKSLSAWEYLRTQPEVILNYLRLSLWPTNLCFDYGWEVQSDPSVYWPLVLLFACIFLAALVFWWWGSVYGFLVLACFIYLAPSSSIVPINDLAVEHRMYLPLLFVIAGIVVVAIQLVVALVRLEDSTGTITVPIGRALAFAMLFVVVSYAWLTYERTSVYQSQTLLWQDTVAKRPSNAKAKLFFGGTLVLEQSNPEAAMPFLEEGLSKYATSANGWHNLAECQRRLGMLAKAAESAERSVSLKPDMGQAHNLLGIIYLQSNQLDKASGSFEKAIRFDQPVGRYNLATIRIRKQEPAKAINQLQALIDEIPSYRNAYRRLAWILATASEEDLRDGTRALRILRDDYGIDSSQDSLAWDAYAAALAESGDFDQAKQAARKALQLSQRAKNDQLAAQIAARLEGYAAGRPHRDDGSDQDGIAEQESRG